MWQKELPSFNVPVLAVRELNGQEVLMLGEVVKDRYPAGAERIVFLENSGYVHHPNKIKRWFVVPAVSKVQNTVVPAMFLAQLLSSYKQKSFSTGDIQMEIHRDAVANGATEEQAKRIAQLVVHGASSDGSAY